MTEIRPMRADDWPAVEAIFVEGIATRSATFETGPPDYESFDASHLAEHRFVAVEDGRVVGWVTLAPTSSRACYAGVVESSVYIAESARRRGVGRALMEAVVASAAAGGIWTIQAGMFPENAASVALHERLGFRLVGRFERIAQLDGVWRDTVLLELRL
ncbi:MAG TPA: GNAT family N-acetyltransferase [Gaiellaceae bacterium]|nr:GNAT family N-acetyltransferase [Gaiellaceae bacterium]